MAAAFELILEHDRPVAALVSKGITDRQLWIIYGFLPFRSYCQSDLAARWHVDRVLCTDDWKQSQLRRKPMLKPRGQKLAFVQ